MMMVLRMLTLNAYSVLPAFHDRRAEGEHVLALPRRAGDRVREGAALAGMGFASLWAHDFERALAEADAAIEVATPIGADPVVAFGRLTRAFTHAVTERLDDARVELVETFRFSRAA